ncbi:hypothetical protein P43SY_003803 [Pythium insidiosum]|uniref:4'-phosphopantetheinyl transferase domain-containing protein n=1 Tax=Pythium insidiosum TaxID=114742 RepID=A0AAD5QA84_PYTIN|nr:hypothetical protein P43SY_003803 [Pythium insidiosum]
MRPGRRVFGIGADVAFVPRFQRTLDRHGDRFLRRAFHPDEIRELASRPPAERAAFLASRWAVKEAAFKAFQRYRVLFPEISVGRQSRSSCDDSLAAGLPREIQTSLSIADDVKALELAFSGETAALAARLGIVDPLVTLSHDEDYALAFVEVAKTPDVMARHGARSALGSAGGGGGGSSALDDDDALDSKVSLHQKEAITAQMIGIISSRLDALQTLAQARKLGLDCDLRVHSDYCSKLVPPLQDPYESRVAASTKAKGVSSMQLASNQAMLERLFGPDEKSRATRAVLKKNRAEQQKHEHRRNARLQLEKQLQASLEGHITRTVESVAYGRSPTRASVVAGMPTSSRDPGELSLSLSPATAPPTPLPATIPVNAKLLLLYTFERVRVAHAKKSLKRLLLSDMTCSLFEDLFWLVFCHFFQKNSLAHQRHLVEAVSARYVKLLTTMRSSADYVLRVVPYAIASGICWGLHYLFPGSRHLYTTSLKNDIYLFVCELLLGLKLCPVSVQTMRRQFFPEEMLDDVNLKAKGLQRHGAQTSADAPSAMPDLSPLLPRLAASHSMAALATPSPSTPASPGLRPSQSESYLVKQLGSENSIQRILDEPSRVAFSSSDDFGREAATPPRVMRSHQLRTFFNASQLSPLMKEFLGAENKSIKKPSYLLRTTPQPFCPVGGEDTYHKFYRRRSQNNLAADALKEQEKCLRDIRQVQADTRRELAALDETRDIVLSSGKKAVQAYCTVLLSKKQSNPTEENAASLPSSSSKA